MDLRDRLAVFEKLMAIYDRFTATLGPFACGERCDCCCTGNVTMTTLEGYRLIEGMAGSRQAATLFSRLKPYLRRNRFQPTLTTNMLARRVRDEEPVPDEGGNPEWGACSALSNAACTVYEVRPFGCRSFFSTRRCGDGGAAQMPPVLVSVNTIFLQTIEHIDRPGCSGNFVDVLLALETKGRRHRYEQGRFDCKGGGLLANQPTPVFMIPPEHRTTVLPVMEAIRSIHVATD
ncbi:MAG: hypothetical protein PVH30_02935 [Desulfobacterales bacterium]|jgi:Fe-S-cluster containining protein